MSQDVTDFAGVMMIIILSVTVLAIVGITSVRLFMRGRRLQALPEQRHDPQLAQLQQTVDAMAIEIERIAENQRFTTKLLAGNVKNAQLEAR